MFLRALTPSSVLAPSSEPISDMMCDLAIVQSIWCGDSLPHPIRGSQTYVQISSSNMA